jgi:hypothetical protein
VKELARGEGTLLAGNVNWSRRMLNTVQPAVGHFDRNLNAAQIRQNMNTNLLDKTLFAGLDSM